MATQQKSAQRAWFEEPVRIELSEEEVLADLAEGAGPVLTSLDEGGR